MPTFWEAVRLLTSRRDEQMGQHRSLFLSLANVFPAPICVFDIEKNAFLWISPGALSIAGLSLEELMEAPVYEFFQAHLVPFEPIAALWSERRAQAEVEFQYRVGEQSYFLQGYWVQLKDSFFALVLQDVTELRLTQEKLTAYSEELKQQIDALTQLKNALEKTNAELVAQQEQLRLLAAVAAHTDNTVIITDAEGKAIWVNHGFEKLTGYTLEEVRGKVPGLLLQGPETDPQTVARIRENLRKKEPFTEEILNYTREGRPYWIRLYITPLVDQLNRITHFLAIELDITEDKKRLEQIKAQLSDIQEARSYARRIFQRFLRPVEGLRAFFRDAQVWDAPFDQVGGDFYFYTEKEGDVIVALGDSTGHGAAAALLSVYALTSLERAAREAEDLAALYQDLVEGITSSLRKGSEGFELALLKYDQSARRLEYLGARRPLWIVRQGELHKVQGSRSDIASGSFSRPQVQALRLEPGDRLYLFSDGLTDQFNTEGERFSSSRLARFLQVNHYLTLSEQVALLRQAVDQWRGSMPQTDDILLLALEA